MPGKNSTHRDDTVWVSGKIMELPYESKKGIVTGVMEYYFIPTKKEIKAHHLLKEYFIKIWEGKLLKDTIAHYTGKNVWMKLVFRKGLWDATSDQHASRYGDYVAVFDLLPHNPSNR